MWKTDLVDFDSNFFENVYKRNKFAQKYDIF